MCYDKAKKEFNKKYCITTLLATDSYLAGVLALNYSLLAHNSDYELVVIVTDSCSKIIFDTLNLYNIKHIKVKDLKPIIPPDQYDYNCTDVGGAIYNKVYAWALTEYERVLFLDADCVVVGDINNIFELNDSCEVCGNISKYKNKQSYAGGLFICSPNKELFNKLVKEVVEIDFMIDPPDAVLLTNNFPLKELKLNNNMIFHYNEKQKY